MDMTQEILLIIFVPIYRVRAGGDNTSQSDLREKGLIELKLIGNYLETKENEIQNFFITLIFENNTLKIPQVCLFRLLKRSVFSLEFIRFIFAQGLQYFTANRYLAISKKLRDNLKKMHSIFLILLFFSLITLKILFRFEIRRNQQIILIINSVIGKS